MKKLQLIELISHTLIEKGQTELLPTTHKPVITGRDPVLTELYNSVLANRNDLQMIYEEADVIIIHQITQMGYHAGENRIISVCDDH